MLPGTTAVLEATAGVVPPVETGVLKEVAEELPPALAEVDPSMAWVLEVQAP